MIQKFDAEKALKELLLVVDDSLKIQLISFLKECRSLQKKV